MDKMQMLELRIASLESRLALAEAQLQQKANSVDVPPAPSILSKLIGMTRRQFGTLCLVMAGKENAEIGLMLGCTESTAKTTARRSMLNLDVSTRSQLFEQFYDEWQEMDNEEVKRIFGFGKEFGQLWQEQPEIVRLVRGE